MNPVEIIRGNSPIILGLPHTGTFVPEPVYSALNERGGQLTDTDWHIEKLYDGLLPGVTSVRALFHRYVIDANRDPSGASLYPGQNTTGLVPLTDFDGHDLWQTPPSGADIEHRIAAFHAPYHAALEAEMERVHALHGCVIVYDCHSIRPQIPFLFDGILPDFNIGTHDGASSAPDIEALVGNVCRKAEGCSSVVNGRFKGGWTTRHYGRPGQNRHAIQMELAQSTYLSVGATGGSAAERWIYDEGKAARLRPHLAEILSKLAAWALHHGHTQ